MKSKSVALLKINGHFNKSELRGQESDYSELNELVEA